nr:MAG TPA: hypothetical protein [Bacteriophage sp.]
MAAKSQKAKVKEYIVTVKENPSYCGEGAGGAQFAHGSARITDDWLAEWFRTHDGYIVESIMEDPEDLTDASDKK